MAPRLLQIYHQKGHGRMALRLELSEGYIIGFFFSAFENT